MRCTRVVKGVLVRAAMLALLAGGASSADAQDSTRAPVRARTAYEDLQLFSQVLNQIRINHPDSIDAHELIMAAIRGMVRAADPHSYVLPAVRLSPALEEMQRSGKLTAVPLSFAFVGGTPVVASISPASKASRLDIVVGDELLAIDGKAVDAESAEELDLALSGAPGSAVTLAFDRRHLDGSHARIERKVVRERVDEESAVPVAIMLDSTTGYVRVTTFVSDKVADDLHGALARLEGTGMRRLVLDLRDNGGGLIEQAARVAGEFLPTGTMVYSAEGRKKEVTDTGRVRRSFWRSERRYPIVVLVNDGTASASELVAGALQDHDRALIVGRPTFGKALLMRGFPLSDGSIIELVVGHVKTPCGRVVQRPYRDVPIREYYRLGREERDTAGRPSCKTSRGRPVYGGGGIYPDVVLQRTNDAPSWVAQLSEADVWLEWIGAWMPDEGARLTTLETFAASPLPSPAGVAQFRSLASRHKIEIPADADDALRRMLRQMIAAAKWGERGALTLRASLDPQVREAVSSFAKAQELLGPSD